MVTTVNAAFLLLLLAHQAQGQLECANRITVNTTVGNDTQDCLEGGYPCSSLDYVLNSIKSNDCVSITSDSVTLSEVVEINNINNITIRGDGNTIIMCHNNSRMTCKNCSNVIIRGITWSGCGDPVNIVNGAINFERIANLSIQDCTFQFSKSRAVTIWTVSGLIEILNTRVINNTNYDTIYCHMDPDGTFRCYTDNCNVNGGVRIQESLTETSIRIVNCIFDHNGHVGEVINSEKQSPVPCAPGYEIADGVGLFINNDNSFLEYKPTFQVNLLIENTTFSSNRGRSGAGAYIKTVNSSSIVFMNTTFNNNSVLNFRINSSALLVFTNHSKMSLFKPLLRLSMCNFYNNSEGRNTIGNIIIGASSELLMDNCTFVSNSKYDITMIEFYIQSTASLVDIKDSQFNNNSGSAVIYFQIRSKDVVTSLFNINMINNNGFAREKEGGLVLVEVSEDNSTLKINELTFNKNNYTSNGGGIYITGSFQSSFQCYIQNSHFENNFGFGTGTAFFSSLSCATQKTYIVDIDNCTFSHNEGNSIVYVAMEYYILPVFVVVSDTEFSNNSGTPLHLFNAALVGHGRTVFKDNKADTGAALHLTDSYVLLNYSSFQLDMVSNFANSYGGAIFIDFQLSNIYLSQCHWLLYPNDNFCDVTLHYYNGCTVPVVMYTVLFCELFPREERITSSISMMNNTALLSGGAIFYANDFPPSESSISTSNPLSIFYIPESFTIFPNINASGAGSLILSTKPWQLKLMDPAVCSDDYTICNISDITLGEELQIPAIILGYNNKSAEATRFFVECLQNCINFRVAGDSIVLINNTFSRIKITGVKIREKDPMTLRLYSGVINVKLNVDLVPCRLGYAYNEVARECRCYSVDNIVSCGMDTTIKKKYWFGMIGEQATLSICPNRYCNFSRTEVDTGSFLLSSFYDDQCGPHRTGQACGTCENGYTLSFDFEDCVSNDDCSPGIMVLIILCIVLYWIVIIVVILVIMYFKINIGYLYGIIYYYSVVDILLGQILNYSDGLNVLDKIITSIVRLSPGFVGFLCFFKGMSGIDQYIIRFIHPTGIIVILFLLSILARYSVRITQYISRGIIPAICLILTLTYTSIADTSLQLLRSLRFADIDKVYTYLSPEYEYLTGRHIFYFMIALVYELVIVIGLPLLLLLEPFINRWINFSDLNLMWTRISLKPILDQFQGCYKDNRRWFAAVYLICRQAILVILIINFSDKFIKLYLLLIMCLATALLHYIAQPYNKNIFNALNQFDAFVLLFLVLVISLQMISVSNGLTTDAIIGISFVLVLFPIIVYVIAMSYTKVSSKDSVTDHGKGEMETFEDLFFSHVMSGK